MKKIRLTANLPVAPAHGLKKGRVIDVSTEAKQPRRFGIQWWVLGDLGQMVGVGRGEAEVVEE